VLHDIKAIVGTDLLLTIDKQLLKRKDWRAACACWNGTRTGIDSPAWPSSTRRWTCRESRQFALCPRKPTQLHHGTDGCTTVSQR